MNDIYDDLYTIVINDDEPHHLPIPSQGRSGKIPPAKKEAQPANLPEQKAAEIELGGAPEQKTPSVPENIEVRMPQKLKSASFDTTVLDKKKADKLKMVYDSIVEMNHSPLKGNFEEQLRELADFTVKEAEYARFRCYWPTYDAMSESQMNWYFHWRSLVRLYVYPQNDLSYIFLYIYELINGAGIRDAEDGFTRLWKLWAAYRKTYPTLDTYLVNWVRDYILYYLKDGCASDYIAKIDDPELRSKFFEYEVEHLIRNPSGVIPLGILQRLSDYKFMENKFFADENRELAEEFLCSVAGQMDLYMRNTRGKSVFELYSQGCKIERTVFPFKNAVFCGVKKTIGASYVSYEECRRLRDFITSTLRQACNRFREFKGYRGKVRVQFYLKELLEYENTIIDVLFYEYKKREAVKNMKKVEIDAGKIRHLIAESEDVKNRLLDGAPTGEPSVSKPDASITEALKPPKATAEPAKIEESTLSDKKQETADQTETGNAFAQFAAGLSDTGRAILRFVYENKPDAAALEAQFGGIFLGVEIDTVNEAALDALGDIILIDDGGVYSVSEDFEDDARAYFSAI